jgi:D-alanyl-D-alanine carboxypeptidase/D-alanyl-D-alanine-endopeptidase (penicillin-binding protein 4)
MPHDEEATEPGSIPTAEAWGRVARYTQLGALAAALALGCASRTVVREPHGPEWLGEQASFALDPLVREGASWGAMVVGPSGDVILDRNSSMLFVPASNLKLITTACALERLGPDHTFLTLLILDGVVRNDTAFGDLVIVGGGDPSFASAELGGENPLYAWCDSVSALGIRVITGDVLGCGDLLPAGMPGAGWAWDDLGFGFAAATSGLCYRDNAADVCLTPTIPGDAVQWVVEPVSAKAGITCHVATGEAGELRSLRLLWPPGGGVTISGVVPADERAVKLPVVATDPPRMAAAELLRALTARGIPVLGQAGVGCGLATDGHRVASRVSPGLADLTTVINHRSKNLWAEQLLRIMGRDGAGGNWTPAAGINAACETLDALGVSRDELSMVDGSGLSRLNLSSPAFMVGLLRRALERTWGESFAASLPLAGRSGNLEERLKGSPAEGRIRAKTGSMQGIRALSGYATTLSGDDMVFSVMINGYSGPGAVMDRALDRFCTLLVTTNP